MGILWIIQYFTDEGHDFVSNEKVGRQSTSVDLCVENFGDFSLGLAIDDHRCRRGFGLVWNGVWTWAHH